MKKRYTIIVLIMLPFLLCCKRDSKKESPVVKDGKILIEKTMQTPMERKRMQPVQSEQSVVLKNKTFQSVITCTPNDTLPKVTSVNGDVFIDNQINLKILNGTQLVVNKTFTKHNFASLVSTGFLKRAILEGMVYDKTLPEGIAYAVSLSFPQSDLYVPITMVVNEAGVVHMERVEVLDEALPADSVAGSNE